MNAINPAVATPDFDGIKTKQNAAWGSGDYGKIGVTLQISGEQLAEALDLPCGSTVLDVAAGNGNVTLALARRFCDVTSTDYVRSLIDAGKRRADAEGLEARFQLADAENLPFADSSFDAVVSTFGVMFAPNQVQCTRELLRTCRSGGKIGMANWTPASFIGQLFKVLGGHVAPPAGVQSPALWGDHDWLQEKFGPSAATIQITNRNFMFRYSSPQHFVEFFRTFYGPVHKAFLSLDDAGQAALEKDIVALINSMNICTDGGMKVPGEYAEVVITKA